MAVNIWKLLRGSAVRVNRQRYYLSMIRNKRMLTASKDSKTFHQSAEKLNAAGFQKNENVHWGEGLNGNELANTGMTSMADLPATNLPGVKEEFSARAHSGLECRRCLTHLAFGAKEKANTPTDPKEYTKTKESLCGLLFNCYVICLFLLSSNILIASA